MAVQRPRVAAVLRLVCDRPAVVGIIEIEPAHMSILETLLGPHSPNPQVSGMHTLSVKPIEVFR